MRRIKSNKSFIIVILIIFVSIGFAYLTTNLQINGISIIKKSVWDVHFENIINENETATVNIPATISNDKLTVNYEVTLDTPGEEYSFYVEVVNNSTFDVMLNEYLFSGLSNNQKKYIIPTVTYADGISLKQYDLLRKNTKELLHVSVKYNDDIELSDLPIEDNDFTLTLNLTYNQWDDNAKERNHIQVVNRKEQGKIQTGDEIAIGSEHFYVVSTNEEKTVMLAKYNLYVGNIYSEGQIPTIEREISPDEEGYGLQNELAKGYFSGQKAIGTVSFSNNKYWINENQIKSQYTNNDIYDETYNESSGENYSIAYYIINYVQKLKQMGANNIYGRLLTNVEVTDLGCDMSRDTCFYVSNDKKFIYDTSYWLGTSSSGLNWVFNIYSNNAYGARLSEDDFVLGVRPAIEIPTSYINQQFKITFDSNGGDTATPSSVVKNLLDKIGDNYYTVYNNIPLNYTIHLPNKVSVEELNDSESPTGKVLKISRTASGDGSAGVYWRPKIYVGEPYYYEAIAKGTGLWRIGHEQMPTVPSINLSNSYDAYKYTFNVIDNKYTAAIFYEASGTNTNAEAYIRSVKIIHLLPEVTRDGYTFAGWYTSPDGGSRISNETLVTKSTTYYAHWVENS